MTYLINSTSYFFDFFDVDNVLNSKQLHPNNSATPFSIGNFAHKRDILLWAIQISRD